MSEEIDLEILFPKLGKDQLTHSFPLDREAAVILEYAIQKYPEISPTCQIFMANDQRHYSYVPPEEKLANLGLHPQHHILVIPDAYDLVFYDVDNRKEERMKIYNSFNVSEVMQVICVRNHLLDPRYYQVMVQSKELDPDEPITEQAPFATSVNFQMAPPHVLYEMVTKDFVDATIKCTTKDVFFIIASMLLTQFGPYKNTERMKYDKEVKSLVPKNFQDDVMFMKNCPKNVTDIYKKMKPSDQAMRDTVDYIMKLQHFSSIVANGERNIGLVGKRQTKDKVTFSLNYSTLRVFKQNAPTLLEKFNISDMIQLQMEGNNAMRFDYEMPEKGGRQSIRCRSDDMRPIYDQIVKRLAVPTARGRSSSAGSRAGGVAEQTLTIPPYVLAFNLFSEVPRSELTIAIANAAYFFLKEMEAVCDKYVEDIATGKSTETARLLAGYMRIVCGFLYAVDKECSSSLWQAYDQVQRLGGMIKMKVAEFMTAKMTLATIEGDPKKKKELKKHQEEFEQKQKEMEEKKGELKGLMEKLKTERSSIESMIVDNMAEKSLFATRPIFVGALRASVLELLTASWLNETAKNRDIIDTLKMSIIDFLKLSSNIRVYAGGSGEAMDELKKVEVISGEMTKVIGRLDRSEADKSHMILLQDRTEKLLKDAVKELNKYFQEHKPVELVAPITPGDIEDRPPDDPRPLVAASRQYIERLTSAPVDNLETANAHLQDMKSLLITLMGMVPKGTRGPMINEFNNFKTEVERSYATNGISSSVATAKRCNLTLETILQSMNPAPELRKQLAGLPKDDARVVALQAIINYLEQNGPLYIGSATHSDLQRFISQMTLAKTATLIELAYTIESNVPENLRKLSECCDPTRDLYKEVDTEMDVTELSKAAQSSAFNVAQTALEARKALRKQEREVTAKYRALNLRLWRIMVVFGQYAADESPGSVGYSTFNQCREAIKTLIEESAYDIKRDRLFLPFIDEFTQRIDKVIASPQDPHCLSSFGSFLMIHQTRPGFYKAAKAISAFSHYVIVTDSNRAAKELVEQVLMNQKFRSVSLMIAGLRRRFQTLLSKVDLAMKTKVVNDRRHSGVDLRGDYQMFLRKYTDELFIIFSQLVVAKSKNQLAIQSLSTGCDAIEKLFPLVMNIEVPAPYLARSVCGIVFSSMETLISECKGMGGKAAQSAEFAFLSVREFLFNVKRKIAEAERDAMSQKTGIGIADMYAVIDRDKKMMDEHIKFQRSIRKRKW